MGAYQTIYPAEKWTAVCGLGPCGWTCTGHRTRTSATACLEAHEAQAHPDHDRSHR